MKTRLFYLALISTVGLFLNYGCGANKKKSNNELNRITKAYKFIPFNIPRDKDGVGTIITFDNKKEAVIATLKECFRPENLTIDTLNSEIASYNFNITKNDTVSFDTGKIFGDDVNFNGAFEKRKVKAINVSFGKVFEIRVTRLSIEKEIDVIKQNDLNCLNSIINQNNFLIERVLGAKELTVTFRDSLNQNINLDADILTEINVKPSFVKNSNGLSTLSFNEPRLIGYRLWQVQGESGFANPETEIVKVTNLDILKLKE